MIFALLFFTISSFANDQRDQLIQIVDLELNKVRERLLEHAITLETTDPALGWLAENGYDPEFGARPLRRLIQNEIEDPLSDGILSGEFSLASVVRAEVDEENDSVVLRNVADDEIEDELEAQV
mgnify:CR=1 FL=1